MKKIIKCSMVISILALLFSFVSSFSNLTVAASSMDVLLATDIDTPTRQLIIQEIIIGILCFAPWIVLIVYLIVKKYQIRYFLSKDTLLCTQRMKKNQSIVLPEQPVKVNSQFLGWFYYDYPDKPFTEEVMPPKNIKLIAKFSEQEF